MTTFGIQLHRLNNLDRHLKASKFELCPYRLCHCVLWWYGFCVAMCCVGKDCIELSLNHALDLYYTYICTHLDTLTVSKAGYGSRVHYISGIPQPRFTKRQASNSIQSKLVRHQLGLGSQIW